MVDLIIAVALVQNGCNNTSRVLSNPCALVLGCTGQDGSLICKSLLNQGFQVIGFTRDATQNLDNLNRLGIFNEVEIHSGDVCDLKKSSKI